MPTLEVSEETLKGLKKQLKVEAPSGEIRIVILQRGWVVVGYYTEDGDMCTVESAAVIRVWGTTKGLGEIAEDGPNQNTKLDPCPTLRFHKLTVIATMDCTKSQWAKHL